MLPILIALAILGLTAVDSGYNWYATNQTTKASDEYNKYVGEFYGRHLAENQAYFERYIRAHHLQNREIRYPIRTGYEMSLAPLYASESQLLTNQYSRSTSAVHGVTNTGRSALFGYGISAPGYKMSPRVNTNNSSFYA